MSSLCVPSAKGTHRSMLQWDWKVTRTTTVAAETPSTGNSSNRGPNINISSNMGNLRCSSDRFDMLLQPALGQQHRSDQQHRIGGQ